MAKSKYNYQDFGYYKLDLDAKRVLLKKELPLSEVASLAQLKEQGFTIVKAPKRKAKTSTAKKGKDYYRDQLSAENKKKFDDIYGDGGLQAFKDARKFAKDNGAK